MKNLIYKELKISINKFFYILPVFLACLMLIPQWIYTIVFSYFFWISVSQICSGYINKEDNSFCSMLPVTKKEIVKSKIYAMLLVEGLHLVLGILFGIIHNIIFGNENLFLEINVAFFGIIIVMFALFNVVFMPLYYKTAYYFGKPVIYGVIVAFLYALLMEFANIKYMFVRNIFTGTVGVQLIVLAVGLLISIILNYIAIKKSIKNYECAQ